MLLIQVIVLILIGPILYMAYKGGDTKELR